MNDKPTIDPLFSRERLAGYDPDLLRKSAITIIGSGAAGNNAALNLALAGLGSLRFIDPDVVEPSNLTRSPLFDRRRLEGGRRRFKARELALGALAFSYAEEPVMRYAVAKIEELGLGALLGSSAAIAAVDSLPVRAYLADATRLLGIPLVEVGFSGHRGQISVFPNRSEAEPCWRCLHPEVEHGGVSCTLYARGVVSEGRVPATQPLAALFGSLAAEHAVQAAHGLFPLGGQAFFLDSWTGRSGKVGITRDPACPGAHRSLPMPRVLSVRSLDLVGRLLEETGRTLRDPIIYLPSPYVASAPCATCGASVPIGKPAWSIPRRPECRKCPELPRLDLGGPVVVTRLEIGSELAGRRLSEVGFAPGALIEVGSLSSGNSLVFQLAGSLDDLFTTLRRKPRNGQGAAGMDKKTATTAVTNHKE